MTDYKPIAAQLARVRHAWKRTAALAGLAVTILEAVGLFTVVLLIDLLFRPGVQGRLVLLALVLLAVAGLLVRHVLRPLFRRITDEQVALFVEEQNPGFEGALIAAAEFGRKGAGAGPALLAAILDEAERRAGHLDIRRVTQGLWLRKYAWSAAAVVLAYVLAGWVFPQTFGWHAVRVMAPWKAPDVKPVEAPGAPKPKPAITFALSATNADVLRGTAFRLEAALSRDPDSPVQLHFRPAAESAAESRWYALPMKSIDKVRAYEGILPDINEAMECYVSAERDRSSTCRVRVYEPLAVEAVEVVTHYPAYLELPDRLDRQPSGDVAAPEGSTVTLRVLANRPLKAGALTWAGGASQPLQPLPAEPAVAAATFAVTTNTTYRYRVEDAMGQVVESPAEAYVKVMPDQPPAIAIKRPVPAPELVMPLSEMTLEAAVNDDFGVAGVDFVYRYGAESEGPEQRLPLAVNGSGGFGVEAAAAAVIQLESWTPPLRGGEVITWHLEARDRKRQAAVTDLFITPVRYLDIWATEEWGPAHAHTPEEPPSLAAILQSAFQIAARRTQLAPRDVEKQAEDLAQTMVNPATKAVWVFVEITEETPPQDVPKIKKVNALAVEGHDALAAHRLDPAVDALRRAVMLMISMGLLEDTAIKRTPPPPGGAAEAKANEQMQQQMEALANLDKQAAREAQKTEKDKTLEQADKTAEVQKQLNGLAQDQKKAADKARELEKAAADAAAKASPPPEQKGARGQAAAQQQKLAETVKAAADEVEKAKGLDAANRQRTAEAMREAARHMSNAARELTEGRLEKATQEADAAHQRLATARDELGTNNQDRLAEALAKAETQAGQILRQQQDVAKATQQAAAKPPADQAQQMKSLGTRQARIKTDLDALQEAVGAQKQAVDAGTVKPETAVHIQDAEREMRRGRAAQKAVNAAVAMAAVKPEEAAAEQQNVAKTLEKAHASLQRATDTMATGFEAELKRARSEAGQVAQKLADLQKPQNPAQEAQDRGTAAAEAVETASRLERHVKARDFVSPEAVQALEAGIRQAQTGTGRVENDKEKAVALAAAIGKVHTELDQAYAKLQENKKLFSSQREECPPQYRPLVNQYFQALSGGK